jgi:hypothetical protein
MSAADDGYMSDQMMRHWMLEAAVEGLHLYRRRRKPYCASSELVSITERRLRKDFSYSVTLSRRKYMMDTGKERQSLVEKVWC